MLACKLPGRECEIECRDLATARIEFQPEKIVPQHRSDGVTQGEPLFDRAHSSEDRQGECQEVPATHARVENFQLFRAIWPAIERTGGWGAVVVESQIGPGMTEQIRRITSRRPPGAERVLKEEEDHI